MNRVEHVRIHLPVGHEASARAIGQYVGEALGSQLRGHGSRS
jgi:hypothetical protein